MSLSQQKIPESKSKSKFQSLNINNLYQGAASRPQSKGPPQKHGLQSLGKVPTARRAPANLPSVKSEKGGNDPTVVLVPTGGGWANKEGEEVSREGSREPQPPPKEEEKTPPRPQQPLSWAGTVGGSGGSRPKLGSNFPALPGEAGRPEEAHSSSGEAPAPDPAYGPGPSLRPQAFANWAAGGKVPGGPPTEGGEGPAAVQPHKPVPPPAARAAPAQYKSIMPGFMEALELPSGPPAGYSRARGNQGNQGPRNGHAAPRHREQRSKPVALAVLQENRPAIIDQEKLQSFDKIDNGDSWTYEDDDFDYNKKLESDEEDAAEEAPVVPAAAPTDPNWADQVGGGTAPQAKPSVPQPQYNFYDEFKQKGGVGFGVDEEEKRRNKKSEEVMKNIERARQRREEEEARYRRGGEVERQDARQDVRQDYREPRGQPRPQADQGRRRNYEERERHERERPHEGGQGGGYKRREEEVRGFQGGRVDREAKEAREARDTRDTRDTRDNREQAPWEPREQQPFDLEAEEKRWVSCLI